MIINADTHLHLHIHVHVHVYIRWVANIECAETTPVTFEKNGTWNKVYFFSFFFRGSSLRDEQDQKNLPRPSTFTTVF